MGADGTGWSIAMMKLKQIPVSRMQNRGNLMQSRFWAMVKNEMGWRPYAFRIEWQEQNDTLLLFIQRPDTASSYSFAYIPWAPTFTVPEEIRGQFLEQVSQKLLS